MSDVDRLIDWFLNSYIYEDDAYLTYYSKNKKGPIYPEITAFAISLSCILYKMQKDKVFLKRAKKCAKYMMKINKNGAIPNLSDNLLYTFDTGIFISSMFDLYALTSEIVYKSEAEKSLDWLYTQWDGTHFLAMNKVFENGAWPHFPSVHLVKLVIPLLKASRYLGNKKYEITALKLLEMYKQYQMENGSFKIDKDSDIVVTHPHCYATEGFLYAYHTLKRQEFLEIAQKSSDWLIKMQNSDGSFFRIYAKENPAKHIQQQQKMKTSDATAQTTRIWKLLGVNQEGIKKAYRYLNGELKDNGLMLLKNTSLRGRLFSWRRAVYSWPTFFYLHSLLLPFGEIEFCEEIF